MAGMDRPLEYKAHPFHGATPAKAGKYPTPQARWTFMDSVYDFSARISPRPFETAIKKVL